MRKLASISSPHPNRSSRSNSLHISIMKGNLLHKETLTVFACCNGQTMRSVYHGNRWNRLSAMKVKENVGKMPRKVKVGNKWMILTSSDQNKSSEFSLTPDPSAGAFLWWWSDDVFVYVFVFAFASRGDLLRDVDQKLYFKFPRVSFPSFSGIPHALISSPSWSEFSLTSCLTSCTNRLLFAGSGGSVAFVTILVLRFDL